MQDNSEQAQSDVDIIIQLMDMIESDTANHAISINNKLKNINDNIILFQKQSTQDIDMIKIIQKYHYEEIRQLQITVARLSNELETIRKSKNRGNNKNMEIISNNK